MHVNDAKSHSTPYLKLEEPNGYYEEKMSPDLPSLVTYTKLHS